MNIFLFSNDLYKSAKWFFKYDPRRANKQILESTQQLALSCDVLGYDIPLTKSGKPYKVSNKHRNHPCTKWTYENLDHFQWHINYVWSLIKAKSSHHACSDSLRSVELFEQKTKEFEVPFIGSMKYRIKPFKIEDNYTVYQKYLMYLMNKIIIQDKVSLNFKQMYKDWKVINEN